MADLLRSDVGLQALPIPARRHAFRSALAAWLFLLPMVVLNVVVVLGPSIASVFYAFTDWSGLGKAKFVGVDNFVRLAHDEVYWQSFFNNARWTVIFLTVPILMGLLGASLVAPVKRGQLFYRLIYFIPYVIASVVNAQIWRNILHPTMGIGHWLGERGVSFADISFFGDPGIVLYSIAFVDNWHWWGFLVVIYLAAMQGVDRELYEAAEIEGAGRWQEFYHVTLPSIRPTLVFTLVMTTIWSFLVFDYVYVLTQGGPANASQVLATYLYQEAFARFEVGYAAAIGVTVSIICGFAAFVYIALRRWGWEI